MLDRGLENLYHFLWTVDIIDTKGHLAVVLEEKEKEKGHSLVIQVK